MRIRSADLPRRFPLRARVPKSPRIISTRKYIPKQGEYFGPYSSVVSMKSVLDLVRQLYSIRTCSLFLSEENIHQKKFKVCLEFHIGNCKGPCEGLQDEKSYLEEIAQARNILKGNLSIVEDTFALRMKDASEKMEFEKAGLYKHKLDLLEKFQSKSLVVNRKLTNIDVITIDHMRQMKDRAIVCNIGHFDSEIQIDALRNYKWEEVKPQVDEVVFPDGKRLIVLSKGRLVNLGNATGHPSFVMSASFTNQTLAQIELFTNVGKYEKKVYTLPKTLDEKVARLHLGKVGADLTVLSTKQSDYISIPKAGPYKPDTYRY